MLQLINKPQRCVTGTVTGGDAATLEGHRHAAHNIDVTGQFRSFRYRSDLGQHLSDIRGGEPLGQR